MKNSLSRIVILLSYQVHHRDDIDHVCDVVPTIRQGMQVVSFIHTYQPVQHIGNSYILVVAVGGADRLLNAVMRMHSLGKIPER